MISHPYSIKTIAKSLPSIKEDLKQYGIVLFNDITSIQEELDTAKIFGEIIQNLDSDETGVTEISETTLGQNKKNSFAFSRAALYPHTDRSPPIPRPPRYLLNWMVQPARKGGETLLVDAEAVRQIMQNSCVHFLNELSSTVATFSDNINSLHTSVFSNKEIPLIRFRNDNCVSFDQKAMPAINQLRTLIDLNTIVLPLKAGEAYLLDNFRWLHGRKSYQGHRVVHRLHLNPFEQKGTSP